MTSNPTDELTALQKKRATLEKVVQIALAVERLNDSLHSIVMLGKPVSSAAPKIKALMDSLEESVRVQPTGKLRETLAHLEKSVQGKLEIILDIAEMNDDQLVSLSVGEEQIDALLETYSKNSQTAVAIKGILHSRGEVTKPTPFSVSSEIIVKKLAEVSAREKTCRKRVSLSIMNMMEETKEMLSSDTLNEGMRKVMENTVASLGLNLEHVESGKSIETMPVPIEIVILSEDEVTHLDSGREQHQHAPTVSAAPPPPPSVNASIRKKARNASFTNKLMRWLTTPKGTTWDDIEKGRDLENK